MMYLMMDKFHLIIIHLFVKLTGQNLHNAHYAIWSEPTSLELNRQELHSPHTLKSTVSTISIKSLTEIATSNQY